MILIQTYTVHIFPIISPQKLMERHKRFLQHGWWALQVFARLSIISLPTTNCHMCSSAALTHTLDLVIFYLFFFPLGLCYSCRWPGLSIFIFHVCIIFQYSLPKPFSSTLTCYISVFSGQSSSVIILVVSREGSLFDFAHFPSPTALIPHLCSTIWSSTLATKLSHHPFHPRPLGI